MDGELARVRDALSGAGSVVTITGAGISAESGIPTFRGAGGYWREHKVEELASPEGFERHPERVWEWYEERRGRVLAASPNAGHQALAALERRLGDTSLVVTQNVDGLHARAGNRRVVEIHGSLFVIRCTACGVERRDESHPLAQRPPRCKACGALERPGVVWFGESLDPARVDRARTALMATDVCLVVGTSGVVQPAASLFLMAQAAGALTVEINPDATPVSSAFDVVLRGKAGELLPALLEEAA